MLSKIAAIFLMPLYTSVLSQSEYGAMALITSCSGVIGLVSNLNIHSGIARDYYEKDIDRKKLVSTGFFSILACASFIFICLLLTKTFWLRVLGIEAYSLSFVLMLCSIPAGSLLSYFAILTRYNKKPVLFTIGTVIQLLVQIGLSIYLILVCKIGVTGIFVGLLAGELVGAIFFMIVNSSLISFQYSVPIIKRALLFALPTLPAILAGWVDTSFGQILIGKYVSHSDLGVYSIALSISSVFTLIAAAFNNVWGPYLYENYKRPEFEKQVVRMYKYLMFLIIIISINLSLVSKEIVLLLTNPSYLRASNYLILLCAPMCIYLILPMVTSGIQISRKTKYISYAYCIGSGINILFLFLLLPKYGVIIVPICLLLSRLLCYFICNHYSVKEINIRYPNILVVILCLVVVVAYFVNEFTIPLWIKLLSLFIIDLFAGLAFFRNSKRESGFLFS